MGHLEVVPVEQVAVGPTSVVAALAAVTAELAASGGVGKTDSAPGLGYNFRGIEALTAALATLLGRHGVVIIPSYELITVGQAPGMKDGWIDATVRATWRIYGPAGDWLEAVTYGVGRDRGDKWALKAGTAAAKELYLRLFVVGDQGSDPDAHSDAGGRAEDGPLIAEEDADPLAERINALGQPGRARWLELMGARPHDLPARRLEDARQAVDRLEAELGTTAP